MILIRDIQGRQHCQPHRVDRIRSLGHGPHLRIHILRQLQNVFRIRPPQVIRLIENLHPHAGILRILQRRILSSGSHNQSVQQSSDRPVPPNSPAPPRSTQSAPASSPRARESLPALSATAPLPAATLPTAPRVPPVADEPAAHRALPLPAPAAPTCTSR